MENKPLNDIWITEDMKKEIKDFVDEQNVK